MTPLFETVEDRDLSMTAISRRKNVVLERLEAIERARSITPDLLASRVQLEAELDDLENQRIFLKSLEP